MATPEERIKSCKCNINGTKDCLNTGHGKECICKDNWSGPKCSTNDCDCGTSAGLFGMYNIKNYFPEKELPRDTTPGFFWKTAFPGTISPTGKCDCNCHIGKASWEHRALTDDELHNTTELSLYGVHTDKYNDGPNAGKCKPCPKGYYIVTYHDGSTSCKPCGCNNRYNTEIWKPTRAADAVKFSFGSGSNKTTYDPSAVIWKSRDNKSYTRNKQYIKKPDGKYISEEDACDGSGTHPIGNSNNTCSPFELWCGGKGCSPTPRQTPHTPKDTPSCSYFEDWNTDCPSGYTTLGANTMVDKDNDPETDCIAGWKLRKCAVVLNQSHTNHSWPVDQCARCKKRCSGPSWNDCHKKCQPICTYQRNHTEFIPHTSSDAVWDRADFPVHTRTYNDAWRGNPPTAGGWELK